MSRANLTKADLTSAKRSGVILTAADLSGAILQNATIDLQLSSGWRPEELEQHFNHIANGKSLLMTVDSIDNTFSILKVDLIHQIINAINQPHIDLTPFHKNFYLLFNPCYGSNDTMKAFLTEKVILPTIEQANSQTWAAVDPKTCEVFLAFIESRKDFDYIKDNGFFVQLVLNSLSHNNAGLAARAERLYQHYLSLESIRPVTEQYGFDINSTGYIDFSDRNAHHYVLVSGDQRMLITAGNLTTMLNPPATDTAMTWDNFYLFRAQAEGKMKYEMPSNLAALFKAFTLFDQQYQFAQEKAKFVGLLNILELGRYRRPFIAAMEGKHYEEE